MKTLIAKASNTAVKIICLLALVSFSAHAVRAIGRHHSAPIQTEAVVPGNYSEVVNDMFGR
jgi:hypothetical protein